MQYIDSEHAIYCLDKRSLLYKGLKLWCHLYHRKLDAMINLTRQNNSYLYFKARVPLDAKTFSKNVLNNSMGINEHGLATPKFIKYMNKRYKALYTRGIFDSVRTVTPYMRCPHAKTNSYYKKMRIEALMENIERGIITIDYSYNPLEDPNLPFPQPVSKGRLLYNRAFQYPYEQIGKNGILYKLLNVWFNRQHKQLPKVVRGYKADKYYIYFGMANIPRKNMWKYKHPNHYSDIDYFLLGGSGDGTSVKKFVNFIRTSK